MENNLNATSTSAPVWAASTPEGDELLAVYYRSACPPDTVGGEISLTVLVGGSWISGTAISRQEWYVENAQLVPSGSHFGDEVPVNPFQILRDDLYQRKDEDPPNLPTGYPIQFLHMRDASFFSDPHHEGILLRIRFDQIQAWSVQSSRPADNPRQVDLTES